MNTDKAMVGTCSSTEVRDSGKAVAENYKDALVVQCEVSNIQKISWMQMPIFGWL